MSVNWQGAAEAITAPEYEEVITKGRITCRLVKHGKYSVLRGMRLEPDGTVTVPDTQIPLVECRLEREEGDIGRLIYEGVKEASSGTTVSTPDSTRINLVWTPRQVPIERGRATTLGSQYDYALLECWKRTEDYQLKKDFKALVPVLYGDTPAEDDPISAADLYQGLQIEVHELTDDTRAIAERIALGMESYEDWYPVVTIRKTWTGAPPSSALVKPGTQGAPPTMPPGISLTGYDWICCAGEIVQNSVKEWTTTNAWTGLLTTARPDNAPPDWGNTPFDARYYG